MRFGPCRVYGGGVSPGHHTDVVVPGGLARARCGWGDEMGIDSVSHCSERIDGSFAYISCSFSLYDFYFTNLTEAQVA